MKPLHHALREARLYCGIRTQTEAAKLSGLTQSVICDLESPRNKGVHLHTLRTLASTYGCTVSELIGEEPMRERKMNAKEQRVVGILLAAMREAA